MRKNQDRKKKKNDIKKNKGPMIVSVGVGALLITIFVYNWLFNDSDITDDILEWFSKLKSFMQDEEITQLVLSLVSLVLICIFKCVYREIEKKEKLEHDMLQLAGKDKSIYGIKVKRRKRELSVRVQRYRDQKGERKQKSSNIIDFEKSKKERRIR